VLDVVGGTRFGTRQWKTKSAVRLTELTQFALFFFVLALQFGQLGAKVELEAQLVLGRPRRRLCHVAEIQN